MRHRGQTTEEDVDGLLEGLEHDLTEAILELNARRETKPSGRHVRQHQKQRAHAQPNGHPDGR